MNFDFAAALRDPTYDEHLREIHEQESEIERAYDAMGPWETHPYLAVHSHPGRAKMTRRERRDAYRQPLVDRVSRERSPGLSLHIRAEDLKPEDYIY